MTIRKSIALMLIVLCSCSKNSSSSEADLSQSPASKYAKIYRLSEVDIKSLEHKAHGGDISSAIRLIEYYGSINNSLEFDRWDQWLAERGNQSSLISHGMNLFSLAIALPNSRPEKINMLESSKFYFIRYSIISKDKTISDKMLNRIEKQIRQIQQPAQ